MKPPYTIIPTSENLGTRSAELAKIVGLDTGTRMEIDPNGISPNQAGAKLDAGKVCPSLIIEGMARALWGVAEVATFGMMKYSRDGWILVKDGEFRYANAGYRHVLKRAMGETVDPDSNLEHLKHEAWNALAKLDLAMRQKEEAQKIKNTQTAAVIYEAQIQGMKD